MAFDSQLLVEAAMPVRLGRFSDTRQNRDHCPAALVQTAGGVRWIQFTRNATKTGVRLGNTGMVRPHAVGHGDVITPETRVGDSIGRRCFHDA